MLLINRFSLVIIKAQLYSAKKRGTIVFFFLIKFSFKRHCFPSFSNLGVL